MIGQAAPANITPVSDPTGSSASVTVAMVCLLDSFDLGLPGSRKVHVGGCECFRGMVMIEHVFAPPVSKGSFEALDALEGELAELCGMANAIHGRMV